MGKTGKTALVTGASAGLGAEFAKLFAADGHDVVLVARRRDKLEALASEIDKQHGVRATVLAEDLAVSEAPARIARALGDRGSSSSFSSTTLVSVRPGPSSRPISDVNSPWWL